MTIKAILEKVEARTAKKLIKETKTYNGLKPTNKRVKKAARKMVENAFIALLENRISLEHMWNDDRL